MLLVGWLYSDHFADVGTVDRDADMVLECPGVIIPGIEGRADTACDDVMHAIPSLFGAGVDVAGKDQALDVFAARRDGRGQQTCDRGRRCRGRGSR